MKLSNLISVIIPFYNSQAYLRESILSVLNQNYSNIEVILVNDGSTDNSKNIALSINDPRIKYLEQTNKGVGAARNLGLSRMEGDYFCFLDADDLLTLDSLTKRLQVFKRNQRLTFVGGSQEQRNEDLSRIISVQYPSYFGNPRAGLIALDPGCFINCGTWLIKKNPKIKYAFPVNMTHSEDLTFFLSISDDGILDYTTETVQIYRRHNSAMSNLDGLYKGYKEFYSFASDNDYFENVEEKKYLKHKIFSIMCKSYLANYNFKGALRVFKDYFFEK